MLLTAIAINQAKPRATPYKLFDGDGLFLLIQPTGAKYWRMKYRFGGVEKTLALGVFSNVKEGRKNAPILISLSEAREKRNEARRLLANGVDPGEFKKQTKAMIAERATNSFEAVAREWITKFSPTWSAGHLRATVQKLEVNLFPWIGARPIAEVTAPELLVCLRRIEVKGAVNAAHRTRVVAGQVFRFDIATGRCENDISTGLKGSIPQPNRTHFPAITDPTKLAVVLRAIDNYPGSMVTICALKLLPMLLARPSELRQAEWSEFDFETATWSIPLERMKTKQSHLVPLPAQAVSILQELHPLTGHGRFVFPGAKGSVNSMSETTLRLAMVGMGFAGVQTPHGFRATARTILDEVLGFRVDLIEHQLAHQVRDTNGRSYNRTSFLPERREMIQRWADYLDGLKAGTTNVIPFKKQA
ncbi:MAG: integrase arm-type DNA-binding domain-containing protein [Magnetococcales bacterium]|nr:integrase arm-type DNA-binding domain-containing protein [Magnetococcales bacterium]